MRPLILTILVGLLLFNTIGLPVVYLMEHGHRSRMLGEGFEQWYPTTSNVVVKIPVDQFRDQTGIHRYDQNANQPQKALLNIQSTQLVGDTVYLHGLVSLNARDHFYNLVSRINDGLEQTTKSSKGDHSVLLLDFLKEYLPTGKKHIFYLIDWTTVKQNFPFERLLRSPQPLLNIATPPPDLA